MITNEVKHYLQQSVLGWLATVDAKGMPNVSPKEIFAAWDDRTLLIAHIASPVSVQNIRHQSNVCFSLVDIWVQKGYKLKGQATLLEAGEEFERKKQFLQQAFTDRFPIAAIIEMHIESVAPIQAPSYLFFPDTTEAAQVASARKRYGV